MKTKTFIIYILALLAVCPLCLEAQEAQPEKEKNFISRWVDSGKRLFKKKEKKNEIHINLHDLTLEENIKIPVPSNAALNNLKTALSQEVRRLSRIKHAQLSTPRKGEVIKVVIPMDQLFQPNDTVLWDRAEMTLRPFVRYIENPDYYHVLLAAYTDDTGSDLYTRKLAAARARAVTVWLQEHGGNADYIIPYGMGNVDPVLPNISDANRNANRRLEIYLVPGEALLKRAEKGKITY
ncbi:OmpA family protein [Coprobacter sp.]